jgi:cobalt-zinc-cadmium efflux system membrane fusion protein
MTTIRLEPVAWSLRPSLLFGLAGCLAIAACGRGSQPPAPQAQADGRAAVTTPAQHADGGEVRIEAGMLRDLRITTAQVESRQGGEQVTLLGELAVDERSYAEVGAPVAARVVRLMAGIGDRVTAGQALLELQSSEVGHARADYLSAVAQLTLAESSLRRKRDLAAERIAPQREVQEAEATVAAARAELRASAAGLQAMGLTIPTEDGSDTVGSPTFQVHAPVAGTVIERTALRGQMLDPGTAAFRIADLSTLWLTVHAFERDAVRIQRGTPAQVAFSALPGQTFTGNVTMVARQVSTESRTVDVRIELRNPQELLRPGMAASAALPIGAGGAPILSVPVAAVQRVGDSWVVFIPRDAGVFETRKIGRGRDLGGEVEVLSGLAVGETIVVDGAFLLKSQAENAGAGHGDH